MITASDVLMAFREFPFATIDQIIGPGAPLIIAPHADDESLGCGGLIAACSERGTPPLIVVVTDGCGSHPNSREYPPDRLRALREQEVKNAITCLGAEPGGITFLGLPDTAAPTKGSSFERAVATISDLVQRHACGTIMAPWRHDPHGDHVAAAAMADACVRATGARCFAYPVWGWTLSADILLPETTVSGFRLKISSHLATKQAAIAAHHSQYSGLISDDPGGFQLPPTLLAIFARPYEVFIKL